MSIEDKIKNAKKTTWLTDRVPEWKVRLWVFEGKYITRNYLRLKAKLKKLFRSNDEAWNMMGIFLALGFVVGMIIAKVTWREN